MSAESAPTIPDVCPTCGAALNGEMCPRCLIGDVLAVLDGPVPPVPTPFPTAPGTSRRIGEYELLEELGRGGMGVVWKARQRRLNRIVALKLVRGGCLPGEAAAKRFRREAEAAAQLKHPNIVVIHEVGEADEQLYLSMDLVAGGSLADWLKRVAFSPRDAATLVAKVAHGVHHAHEHGVLHRDLKPGNILLDASGEPRVCDFGLARFGDVESSLTMSGELLGTPAYLSPEQAAGKMRDLTPASDTYSLGAILYELLVGHPPFSADNLPALLRKVAEDDPMRPISHYSGGRVPFDLSTICLKCLDKDPMARYSSALALAEDLERWLRGEPILARPVPRVERVWKWVRRKPVLAALWFLITLLTVVIAVVASVMSFRLGRERKAVAALAEQSRHQVARQLSESAQRYMSDGDHLRALPALAEAIQIGTGDPRLDEADRIRFGVLLRGSPKLAHAWLDGVAYTRTEASKNGERIMLVSAHSAEVWDVIEGKRIGEVFASEKPISNVQFDSFAGKWVLLEAEGRLTLWEPDSKARKDFGPGHIYSPPDAYLQQSPDSVFLSYGGNAVEARSLEDGRRVAGPLTHLANVVWAIMVPGLGRVLSADADGRLYFWNAATGAPIGEPTQMGKGNRPLTFDAFYAPRKHVAIHRDRECWVIDCRSGAIVAHLWKAENIPQSFGWDEEGEPLFLARSNDGVTLRKVDKDMIRWFFLHNGLGFRGSFAPHADLVATQSWNWSARVWEMSNGRPVSPYLWQTATPGSCILDPEGDWLLTRGDEPAARFWQLRKEDGAFVYPGELKMGVNLWVASAPERIFAADENGTVRAWHTGHPRLPAGEVRHPEAVIRSGASKDGGRFFTAGPRSVQVWDGSAMKALGALIKPPGGVIDAALDPSGGQLAIAESDGGVSIWRVSNGEKLLEFAAQAQRVAYSSSGRALLVTSKKAAQMWDPANGKPLSKAVEQPVSGVAAKISPDGTKVLQWSAEASGQVSPIVWDAKTGEVLRKLPHHWEAIGDACWSPDSRLVATGGEDHTVLISDVSSGSLALPPIKHIQKVRSVGFSKDGLLLWSVAEKEIVVSSAITGEPVTPPLRQTKMPMALAFTGEDSRELTVLLKEVTPRAWDLRPEPRKADELRAIAHALSAHALAQGTSALRPLSLVELRSAWERARKSLSSW